MLAVLITLAVGCGAPPVDRLGPRPTLAPPTAYTPPVPTVIALPRVPPIWHLQRASVPLVSVVVVVPYGAAADPPGKAGLAALTAEMMEQGAGPRGALALGRAVERLGATMTVTAGADASRVSLTVLADRLEPALALLADVVARPRFEPAEWARTQPVWIDGLRSLAYDVGAVADRVADVCLFGLDHPYGHPIDGLPATVSAVTLADVKAFHARYWRPERATVVVVGAVDETTVRRLAPSLVLQWAGPGESPPWPTATAPAPPGPPVVAVERPDSPQTMLLLVAPGQALSAEAQAAQDLVHLVLGGMFTSRLNLKLREEKGYTYGAGSGAPHLRGPYRQEASAAVQAEVTVAAIADLRGELARFAADGPTPAELEKARAAARAADVEIYEGVEATASRLAGLAALGLPPDADAQAARAREQVDAAAARRAAAALGLERGTLVIVGDAPTIQAAVTGPIERRDAEGALVSER
ncbi:MAG: insulinase family protein [Myxococcales bacterium]|nr:insulinase family protein [Myxococcales bacterium]